MVPRLVKVGKLGHMVYSGVRVGTSEKICKDTLYNNVIQ